MRSGRGIGRSKLLRILVFVCILGSCREDAPLATLPEEALLMGADAVLTVGVMTITNEDGIRTARLQFDTAFQWRDSTHQLLRGVDLTVFNENGSERARVTALRGRFEPREESLTAYGDVVLIIPFQDRRLETQELHYDPEADELRSDSAVVITEGDRSYEGTSFNSDLEFRNFEVQGTVGTGP